MSLTRENVGKIACLVTLANSPTRCRIPGQGLKRLQVVEIDSQGCNSVTVHLLGQERNPLKYSPWPWPAVPTSIASGLNSTLQGARLTISFSQVPKRTQRLARVRNPQAEAPSASNPIYVALYHVYALKLESLKPESQALKPSILKSNQPCFQSKAGTTRNPS